MNGIESPIDQAAQTPRYNALRSACHPGCVADPREGGLGLRFELNPDRSVTTHFRCAPEYQGYPDRLHGGIIATLLDAAMTHCLFAQRYRGVTAKLSIRYPRPVLIDQEATIRAVLKRHRGLLFELRAELQQAGELCASAEATFIGESV